MVEGGGEFSDFSILNVSEKKKMLKAEKRMKEVTEQNNILSNKTRLVQSMPKQLTKILKSLNIKVIQSGIRFYLTVQEIYFLKAF